MQSRSTSGKYGLNYNIKQRQDLISLKLTINSMITLLSKHLFESCCFDKISVMYLRFNSNGFYIYIRNVENADLFLLLIKTIRRKENKF